MSEIEKRLREEAHEWAAFATKLQAAKTKRNREAGDVDADYAPVRADQTFEWKAADEIASLRAQLAEAVGLLVRVVAVADRETDEFIAAREFIERVGK